MWNWYFTSTDDLITSISLSDLVYRRAENVVVKWAWFACL